MRLEIISETGKMHSMHVVVLGITSSWDFLNVETYFYGYGFTFGHRWEFTHLTAKALDGGDWTVEWKC
jgi:hypothetical protein